MSYALKNAPNAACESREHIASATFKFDSTFTTALHNNYNTKDGETKFRHLLYIDSVIIQPLAF